MVRLKIIPWAVLIFLVTGLTVPLSAQMWEQQLPDDFNDVWQPAPTPAGAVAWDLLTSIQVKEALIDNFYQYVPTFTPAVEALNGTKVKLNGYMVPLEPTDKQSRFLLTPYSHSCPFHMPAGPAGFVLVEADFPVEFVYEPVLIEGHFQTLTDVSEGIFYSISAAQQVE